MVFSPILRTFLPLDAIAKRGEWYDNFFRLSVTINRVLYHLHGSIVDAANDYETSRLSMFIVQLPVTQGRI